MGASLHHKTLRHTKHVDRTPVHDIYIINLETGERRQIKEKSPLHAFLPKMENTHTGIRIKIVPVYPSTAVGKEYRLTTPQTFAAWDEDNDVPDYPSPYGIAGWTDDDQSILIKDRYDIWKFDPIAASSPVNLTVNGRKEQITYSLIQLDREKRAYNTSEAQYLTGFNERNQRFRILYYPPQQAGCPESIACR